MVAEMLPVMVARTVMVTMAVTLTVMVAVAVTLTVMVIVAVALTMVMTASDFVIPTAGVHPSAAGSTSHGRRADGVYGGAAGVFVP